jgi:hypothetical protein
MPNPNLRSWTEADNAKLKSLAGKLRPAEIAAELGRSAGATVLQASKLKVSLSSRRKRRKTAGFEMDLGQPIGIRATNQPQADQSGAGPTRTSSVTLNPVRRQAGRQQAA